MGVPIINNYYCLEKISKGAFGEVWKGIHFFPIHCHFCCYSGMQDDFHLENIFILCKNCHNKLVKRKKELNNFIHKTV